MPVKKSKSFSQSKFERKFQKSFTEPESPSGNISIKPPIESGLYIVSTPIGNARDITLRAVDILKYVDAIVCEDTRITRKLLNIHKISNHLLVYHEHNAHKVRVKILDRLKNDEAIAIVSDAGSPLISDPGYKLIQSCITEGIAIHIIPGASSVITALVISGLPTDRFFFQGFLPKKPSQRIKCLKLLHKIPGTLIIFETGPRLCASLTDMLGALGNRKISITRELTKKYEEITRSDLICLVNWYSSNPYPKGELTIVIGPEINKKEFDEKQLIRKISKQIKILPLKKLAQTLSIETGVSKTQIYDIALNLKKQNPK